MNGIKERLVKINEEIRTACRKAGRNPDEITLVAVTKTLPAAAMHEAFQYGVKIVGENKVQELKEKFEKLRHLPLSWHFIGYLQTNKVKFIVDKVDLIHSVDRLKLAEEISKECLEKNIVMNILVQVNISGESSKAGVDSGKTIKLISNISGLPGIKIKGLMTMAPYVKSADEARPVFAALRELAGFVSQENIPGVEMQELSMGMTNDFQVAILEGATMVRIGSGIFGERR